MNKQQREKLIKSHHPYKIWCSTDGRWRTYIPDDSKPNKRRLVIKTSKATLEEFIIEHYRLDPKTGFKDSPTLLQLYPEWLDYKNLHTTAPTYITRINSDWKTYYLGTDIINIPIHKLDKLTLDKWAHRLIKQYNMTKNQYYNVTVIMRQELLYAVDLGIISCSPFAQVKIDGKRLFRKVHKKPDYTQVFFKEECKLINDMAWKDFRDRIKVYELAPLALLFQFQTGLRIGEICAVKYTDIEAENYLHVQRMVRRDTKEVVEHIKGNADDRMVFLTSTAKLLIQAAKEHQTERLVKSEYIFSMNSLPITERSVSTLYDKYCRHIGCVHKSSHKARKTYISALLDGKVNLNTVRELAGHSNEKTTLQSYVYDRSTELEKFNKVEQALSI